MSQSKGMKRVSGILGFFVGIFGALAILGVFFKILKLPHYELFMAIGFIGEAAAFVIMGVFALIGAFSKKGDETTAAVVAAPGIDVRPALAAEAEAEVRAAVQESLQKRVSEDVERMMEALSQEVGRFGEEIHHVGSELTRAREAILTMRNELDRVASGDLAGDAERLGRGMQVLGDEMSEAGGTVERLRSDLDEMARRFRSFNEPRTLEPVQPVETQHKIKKMPWS